MQILDGTIRLAMLNIGVARSDNPWEFNNVSSPFTRIYMVAEGTAEFEMNGATHILTPGHLYLQPAFTQYSARSSGPFGCYYLHLYIANALDGRESPLSHLDMPFEVVQHPWDRQLFDALRLRRTAVSLNAYDPQTYETEKQLIRSVRAWAARPLADRLEASGIMRLLLSRFVSAATPRYAATEPRMLRALIMMDATYFARRENDASTLQRIAAAVGLSADHFARLFRKELGRTPSQYLIERRMRSARLMLASTDRSIKDIALSLGYDDLSYITRQFRVHAGTTPLQYRRSFNIESASRLRHASS